MQIKNLPATAINTAFKHLVAAHKEYKTTCEIERTKRAAIQSHKEINIKAIEENSKLLKQYLEGIFSERRLVIQKMFDTLDAGIEGGDNQIIAKTLDSIVSIAKESPLTAAQEMISNYHNPDIKHIEI